MMNITDSQLLVGLGMVLFICLHLVVLLRVILLPHREPASRVA